MSPGRRAPPDSLLVVTGCAAQVATAFGEYTGGALRVHGQESVLDIDTHSRRALI